MLAVAGAGGRGDGVIMAFWGGLTMIALLRLVSVFVACASLLAGCQERRDPVKPTVLTASAQR